MLASLNGKLFELKTAVPLRGPHRPRRHAAVVLVVAAIEADRLDAGRPAPFRPCALPIAVAASLLPVACQLDRSLSRVLAEHNVLPSDVVDQLAVNVFVRCGGRTTEVVRRCPLSALRTRRLRRMRCLSNYFFVRYHRPIILDVHSRHA